MIKKKRRSTTGTDSSDNEEGQGLGTLTVDRTRMSMVSLASSEGYVEDESMDLTLHQAAREGKQKCLFISNRHR